jgi:hypothetical protein
LGETRGHARARAGRCALLLALLALSPAAAQDEIDRQDLPERPDASEPAPAPADPAPVRSDASGRPVPDQTTPRDKRFIPESPDFDPTELPDLRREPEPAPAPSLWDEVKLKHRGRVRVGAGYDSNVFRSDRNRTGDGFGTAEGEAELLLTFPQGTQVFGEVGGETIAYFERDRADEHFGSAFVELFQPTKWIDLGLQNAFEYSRQNLLDDNGDLFPRGRFGSVDEELRAYVIFRPGSDVSLESGASYRWKDYEENSGIDSLDYEEVRLDGSIGWKLSRDPRTRLKLKYRFRRRAYREFRERARDGTVGPDEGHLDLHRHQVNLTGFQDLTVAGQQLRIVLGVGAAYNIDLHENDRSYREASASAQLVWWPVPQRTKLELGLRAVGRDFLVRHPPGQGGRLQHRLVDVTLGVWQRLSADYPIAVWAEVTATRWRSGDPLEGYERFIFQGGIEVFW